MRVNALSEGLDDMDLMDKIFSIFNLGYFTFSLGFQIPIS